MFQFDLEAEILGMTGLLKNQIRDFFCGSFFAVGHYQIEADHGRTILVEMSAEVMGGPLIVQLDDDAGTDLPAHCAGCHEAPRDRHE